MACLQQLAPTDQLAQQSHNSTRLEEEAQKMTIFKYFKYKHNNSALNTEVEQGNF